MKKIKWILTAVLLILVLAFSGCSQSKKAEEDDAFLEEELEPLEGEELEMMEGSDGENSQGDDEMIPITESELADLEEEESAEENISTEEGSGGIQVQEDGTYTSRDEVAAYLYKYGHLPSNYITKKEAQDLGWDSKSGNLDEVAPGMSIGGDSFGNYDGMLPVEEGRTYQECDVDYEGGYRNAKRIVFSNDGLIFYTDDHYETFQQLY